MCVVDWRGDLVLEAGDVVTIWRHLVLYWANHATALAGEKSGEIRKQHIKLMRQHFYLVFYESLDLVFLSGPQLFYFSPFGCLFWCNLSILTATAALHFLYISFLLDCIFTFYAVYAESSPFLLFPHFIIFPFHYFLIVYLFIWLVVSLFPYSLSRVFPVFLFYYVFISLYYFIMLFHYVISFLFHNIIIFLFPSVISLSSYFKTC